MGKKKKAHSQEEKDLRRLYENMPSSNPTLKGKAAKEFLNNMVKNSMAPKKELEYPDMTEATKKIEAFVNKKHNIGLFNLEGLQYLDIFGKKYRLDYIDDEELSIYGVSNSEKQYIKICKSYDKDRVDSTLLHEMIHIIAAELDIKLDEHQVVLLEAGLFSIFKQNNLFKKE